MMLYSAPTGRLDKVSVMVDKNVTTKRYVDHKNGVCYRYVITRGHRGLVTDRKWYVDINPRNRGSIIPDRG